MNFNTTEPRTRDEIERMFRLTSETGDLPGCNSRANLLYCVSEKRWMDEKRPFFNVHPVILECLLNTKPQIDPAVIPRSLIHRLGVIEVRTPAKSDLPAFLLAVIPPVVPGDSESLELFHTTSPAIYYQCHPFGRVVDPDIVTGPLKQTDAERVTGQRQLRVALGLLFLASDDRWLDPVLLVRDRTRNLDAEGRARAVRRASRRGVIGFDVGREVEVSPHFRRPHFAIRWTGKGRKIPRLVPVKGAIVNRKLLEEIPTGYEDSRT